MNKLGTWMRGIGGRGDGYEGPPPNVRSYAFESRLVRAWIAKDPLSILRVDNPPAWVNNESLWEKAKRAVEPYWSDYDEPWAVVSHVYFNMGGT